MAQHPRQSGRAFGMLSAPLRHGVRSLLAVGLILGNLGCQRTSSSSSQDGPNVDHSNALESDRAERKAVLAAEIASQMSKPLDFEFDFDVTDVGGLRVKKADSAGRVLIVNFGATWASKSGEEASELVRLYSRFHDRGLEIIAFYSEAFDSATDVDTKRIRDFCRRHKVPYTNALLLPDVANQVPNLKSLPEKLFIDRKGKPRLMIGGVVDPLKLEAIVEHLLKE